MESKHYVIIGVIILILGYYLYSTGYLDGVVGSGNKVSCTVEVRNPATNDIFEINSATCQTIGECGLFTVTPLAVGENIAKVSLIANGKIAKSENIEIEDFLGGTGTVILTGCVGEATSGQIQVKNYQGVLTDSMNVGF